MKYLVFTLLKLCFFLGLFLGLVGSAEDISFPVTLQTIALSISTFGFSYFFKIAKNKVFKSYCNNFRYFIYSRGAFQIILKYQPIRFV